MIPEWIDGVEMAIDKSFFENNRTRYLKEAEDNTASVFFAGEPDLMCSDTAYRFLSDRNFYYLTGIEDHSCCLILIKRGDTVKERLYVPEKSELKERWTGKRKSPEEFEQISGIPVDRVRDLETLEQAIFDILKDKELKICYDSSSVKKNARNFYSDATKDKTSDEMIDVKNIFTRMRMVKSSEEIESIREAAKITEDAIEELKSFIRPGMTEQTIYTKLEYELMRRGSMVQAFETIVAVGENAFYLHHSDPDDSVLENGMIIQLDLGARYSGYCADISRALFVGKTDDDEYEGRKLKLLELIRTLRKEAFAFIKPGETFKTLNEKMRRITFDWLVSEGLIQLSCEDAGFDDKIVSNYYWHNTSHHLGLDVHDVSFREEPFREGNCLAVEPGVYIKEWGIGFRIEDDVLVSSDGCELLSSGKDDLEVL